MNEWTPERLEEMLNTAKGLLEQRGETTEEQIAETAFSRAAETVIDRVHPGEFRKPDDVTIMEALQAQTFALIGIGQLLEVVVEELRKK